MKRYMILFLVVCVLFSAAACSGRGGNPQTDAYDGTGQAQESRNPVRGGTVITVVTSYGRDDGNRKSFEAAVKEYERISGNTVLDDSASSNEEWKTEVLTDFETGSEPDVLFFFTDADADALIQAGKVVSIEEIREIYPDYATNMRLTMMSTAADGNHYAVPSAGIWENLFVNKQVLMACGVAVPGEDYTWEQFLQDCETIKKAGYTPIACSLYAVPHYWFEFAVMNNGTLENQLEVPQVDVGGALVPDAASEKWIAALEDIRDLYERGFFPDNTLRATDSETVALFAEGKAAFMIEGSWKVGYLTDNYPEELENYMISYVPAKGYRQATEAIGGISMGYFITRKAWDDPEKREAAVKFVSYLTSDEVLSTFVTTEVTALVNGATPAGLNLLQQSAADANANITGVIGAVQDTISGDARAELFSSIPKVVAGEMMAQAAVEAAMRLN